MLVHRPRGVEGMLGVLVTFVDDERFADTRSSVLVMHAGRLAVGRVMPMGAHPLMRDVIRRVHVKRRWLSLVTLSTYMYWVAIE